jgi:uncharacterized membrane protein
MNWRYIAAEVIGFYLKALGIFFAYFLTRNLIHERRSRQRPPWREKALWYICCLGVAGIVAAFIGFSAGDAKRKTQREQSEESNRAAIVFFTLTVAMLFGAADGFSTPEKYQRPRPSAEDEL